ncbi:MAG: hypothetical protein L0H41_13790 [Microlunatus sp.]|nr:hypothetical protein [Microlunatus sp.]
MINLVLIALVLRNGPAPNHPAPDHIVQASLVAFGVAVAARHDGVVRIALAAGLNLPSYHRHQLSYHLGQLHRAMAIAATGWVAIAVAQTVTRRDAVGGIVGAAALLLLVAIGWSAREPIRRRLHNAFEAVHRFGGWATIVILSWLVVRGSLLGRPPNVDIARALAQPSVGLLVVVVGLVVHPWLGVRRLPVEIIGVTPDVVILALPGRRSVGEFVRVSRDGREWHSFAVSTVGTEGPGRFCLVIRRAGDWTERLGRDAHGGRTPGSLLVRPIRGYGFMLHAQSYRRVLFVATGAGIGPVLPYLLGQSGLDFECLWIGRDHRRGMGSHLVDELLARGSVTLIDTAGGRPDVGSLVRDRLVGEVAVSFDAVFVVSNAAVRDVVARVCWGLHVPCYGPTFDS